MKRRRVISWAIAVALVPTTGTLIAARSHREATRGTRQGHETTIATTARLAGSIPDAAAVSTNETNTTPPPTTPPASLERAATAISSLTPPPRRPAVHCAPTGDPTTGTVPADDFDGTKRWVTLGSLQTNCDARSAVFRVHGVDTRIAWRNDASAFVVWVVDARQGLDATAGYADVECNAACADQQILTLVAGDYYLEVQAGDAPWSVSLQEYR